MHIRRGEGFKGEKYTGVRGERGGETARSKKVLLRIIRERGLGRVPRTVYEGRRGGSVWGVGEGREGGSLRGRNLKLSLWPIWCATPWPGEVGSPNTSNKSMDYPRTSSRWAKPRSHSCHRSRRWPESKTPASRHRSFVREQVSSQSAPLSALARHRLGGHPAGPALVAKPGEVAEA